MTFLVKLYSAGNPAPKRQRCFSNNFLTNERKMSFCVNHDVSTLAGIDLLVTQTELLSEISASYHEMECHSTIRVSLRTKRSGVRVPSSAPKQPIHQKVCRLFFCLGVWGLEPERVKAKRKQFSEL